MIAENLSSDRDVDQNNSIEMFNYKYSWRSYKGRTTVGDLAQYFTREDHDHNVELSTTLRHLECY